MRKYAYILLVALGVAPFVQAFNYVKPTADENMLAGDCRIGWFMTVSNISISEDFVLTNKIQGSSVVGTGPVIAGGTLYGAGAVVSNDAAVLGNFGVTGAAVFASSVTTATITVSGPATLGSAAIGAATATHLRAESASFIAATGSALVVTGNADVASNLTAGALSVTGAAAFSNTVAVASNLTVGASVLLSTNAVLFAEGTNLYVIVGDTTNVVNLTPVSGD